MWNGANGTSLAFIANTDFGWFSHFLHRAEPPDEVDFWQPSPHGFRAIPPGAGGRPAVICPSGFSADATRFAEHRGVQHFDSARLRELLERAVGHGEQP